MHYIQDELSVVGRWAGRKKSRITERADTAFPHFPYGALQPSTDRNARCFLGIEKKHGTGKALSILAHKLGRAVFYMRDVSTVMAFGLASS